jgi:hypothetical protein
MLEINDHYYYNILRILPVQTRYLRVQSLTLTLNFGSGLEKLSLPSAGNIGVFKKQERGI